jgi:hypothetical protein
VVGVNHNDTEPSHDGAAECQTKNSEGDQRNAQNKEYGNSITQEPSDLAQSY